MKNCCSGKKAQGELRLAVEFLKLMSEENRLKIVCLLAQGELCVCDIWSALSIPQNLASHHLKALKEFGIIESRKEGLKVFYSINNDSLNSSKKLFNEFLTIQKKVCKSCKK